LPADTPAPPPFATNIGNLTISGGRLDFEDRQVTPAYGNSLGDLHGSITNLSSMTESSAQVELAGKLDQLAPMQVTGRINPLRRDLLVDLKVDFHDINLSPLSPYSGKFIGYKIDKGKLNLDLKYNIAGRKLDSQNKAFIDQLTLGDKVDSPEATNLPVNLALALLRDRQGGINLDVPVYGSLDDPDFSVGRIVIKVLQPDRQGGDLTAGPAGRPDSPRAGPAVHPLPGRPVGDHPRGRRPTGHHRKCALPAPGPEDGAARQG